MTGREGNGLQGCQLQAESIQDHREIGSYRQRGYKITQLLVIQVERIKDYIDGNYKQRGFKITEMLVFTGGEGKGLQVANYRQRG